MSEVSVPVVTIRGIEHIPGADAIELAVIGDYRSVVRKGQFQPGDVVAYIPEASVLPESLIADLGLEGKLAGGQKNRVKAMKLRGCLSQGLLYRGELIGGLEVGDNAAHRLAITKYEPTIPSHMAGEVANLYGMTLPFDIENFKRYPDAIEEGESVEFTEKLHGTFCGVTIAPGLDHPDMIDGDTLVYSKGLGARGLVFKDNEANAGNLYMQTIKSSGVIAKIKRDFPRAALTILGEIYGDGVQDLRYGRRDKGFALFEVYWGAPGVGEYAPRALVAGFCRELGIPRVPVLYSGPFSRSVMRDFTDGKTVAGDGAHIREGIVITPTFERRDPDIGRVILKSVSGAYLLRKGGTTEFS